MYRLSDDLYYLEFERYDLMDNMDAIEKYYPACLRVPGWGGRTRGSFCLGHGFGTFRLSGRREAGASRRGGLLTR